MSAKPITGRFYLDASAQDGATFTIDRAVWESMTPAGRRAHIHELLIAWANQQIDLDWYLRDDADQADVADDPEVTPTIVADEDEEKA
jgi:hypothetical protein